MSNNGTPLRVIQEVSGHRNLEQLQVYIEVRDDQVLGAVTGLSMLSPMPDSGKSREEEQEKNLYFVALTRAKQDLFFAR
jgi:integrase/recombinase XerD